MKIGRLFSDLLAALGRSASPETGFALALKRLIALTGARAGALRFEPGRGAVLDMIVGARKASPLAGWLTARLDEPTRGIRLSRLGEPPPGWSGRQLAVLLRTTLGDAASPAGSLVLIGPGGRRGLGASLDLDPASHGAIRVRVGEGITGAAVQERRPVQSPDVFTDPRVRYPQLQAESGLRSMLAAPLILGEDAIGALTVLRQDVHHFTAEEESLLSAFADQAAMALEHARLFSSVRTYSEQLEAMVTARTRELDDQKRFVEVVLETLPLGLFVLDAGLRIVSVNREGAALLPAELGAPGDFLELLPPTKASTIRELLEAVLADRQVRRTQEDLPRGAETLTLRLTAAPLRSPAGETTHALVLVEDITLQQRLERQMLLTERLTTAGRLAAGVAHELNNPLATIAGCAEALKERAAEPALRDLDAFKDFPTYLSVIEDEAYRCKEITGSLLQFVRDPGSRRAAADLNALVEKALELLSHQSRFAESRLETDLDPALPDVVANEGQIRQVFLGLAGNALEAMDRPGRGPDSGSRSLRASWPITAGASKSTRAWGSARPSASSCRSTRTKRSRSPRRGIAEGPHDGADPRARRRR